MIKELFEAYEYLKQLTMQDDKQIFIRGFGKRGVMLKRDLVSLGIRVDAFLDMDPRLGESSAETVYSSDYIDELEKDSFFLINSIKSDTVYAQIREEWESKGLLEGRDFIDFGFTVRVKNEEVTSMFDISPRYRNRKESLVRIAKTRDYEFHDMGGMELRDSGHDGQVCSCRTFI